MTTEARDTYLAAVDPAFRPVAETLARVVTAAAPELTGRMAYGMLMYVAGKDPRNVVCAVGVTSKVVTLRFLFGAWLSDELGRLRPGSSHLSSIDFKPEMAVDEAAVTAYVRAAASRHEELKARAARPKPGA